VKHIEAIGGNKNAKTRLRVIGRLVFSRFAPKIPYPVLVGPLRRARFILGALAGEGGGASVYLNGVEPEQTQQFVHLVRPGQVLFDIGANVGYYSILGSRLVGERGAVVAVEPAIRNLYYLYRHVTLNQSKNVLIIGSACSDQIGLAKFSNAENFALGHLDLGGTGGEDDARFGEALVPIVTIDAISDKLGRDPDIIKIDVEGAELSVLMGAEKTLNRKKAVILLSVHSDRLRSTCIDWLEHRGYAVEPVSGTVTTASEYVARQAD
jgi:FkbM family methyltransferase